MKMKKRLLIAIFFALLGCILVGCAEEAVVDYPDVAVFEQDLNAGKDLTGKVVTFTVSELKPNSAFGYNMQTGEHLNFCSEKNPNVTAGDTVTVRVLEVTSMMGSYIISYEFV